MPRVYVRDDSFQDNQPLDFCRVCWPPTAEDVLRLSRHWEQPLVAPVERITDDVRDAVESGGHDHPPYEDVESQYTCDQCGKAVLTPMPTTARACSTSLHCR